MDPDTLKFLIPMTAIVMGSLMLLIPIAAFSLRFAIKPVMEAIAKSREFSGGTSAREVSLLEQRVALLEQHYQSLEHDFARVTEVKEFERRLSAPPGGRE